MPPRRRATARVTIPDTAGLARDHQKVGWQKDPWDKDPFSGSPITKSWADSLADPEDPNATSPLEPNGPDYWFQADVPDVDFDVHFRLGITDEGALIVTGLLLGDPGGTQPITTSNLHRLPIGAIYDAIGRLEVATTSLADKARRFKGEIPTRGGQRKSEDEFRQAAEVYRECVVNRPNDTIKCVAERLSVSSATASRRVSRARDMGLLTDPDKVLLKELKLQAPWEMFHQYPKMRLEGRVKVHFDRYERAHRRAWVSLDQLKRAEDDDKRSSTTTTSQAVEMRSKRYHRDLEGARKVFADLAHAMDKQEKESRPKSSFPDEPPF